MISVKIIYPKHVPTIVFQQATLNQNNDLVLLISKWAEFSGPSSFSWGITRFVAVTKPSITLKAKVGYNTADGSG